MSVDSVKSVLGIPSSGFATADHTHNTYTGAWIELTSATPYIDFHYNGSTADYTTRIIADAADRIAVHGNLAATGYVSGARICAGYDSGYAQSVNCSNWFRSSGNTGWYNGTHGGGWFMQDSSWIRSYNDKGVYSGGEIQAGQLRANGWCYVNVLNSSHCVNATTTAATNCYIDTAGSMLKTTNTSSKRFKDNITTDLPEELNPEKLYDVDVVSFKYKENYFINKDDIRYRKDMIGFIAENIFENYPMAADYHFDENGEVVVDAWNDQYLIPAMLKLIQLQNDRIKALEKQNEEA